MVRGKIENMYYINAPAGTGKTHSIIEKIINATRENPWANILCITFTKRAAKELKERVAGQVVINNEKIEIDTIHGFLSGYFKQYFSLPESLKLYFKLYEEKILDEITKNDKKGLDDPKNKNISYLEKINKDKSIPLTLDIIKENLSKLEYDDSQFSNYYEGRLSHDDLVFFASNLVKEYSILQKSIGEKYAYIFIDECQDTSSDILRLFYSVAERGGSNVKLFLYGDKMQEIYDNYDGSFEDEYGRMNQSIKLTINYRSSKEIVDMLAHLYGEPDQKHKANRGELGLAPVVYLTTDIENKIAEINRLHEGCLTLRVFNKDRFKRKDKSENMSNLFDAYYSLIPYGARESHIDVLVPLEKNSSPDHLLNLLWQTNNIVEGYENKQYGYVIQQIKANSKYFNVGNLSISYHSDKEKIDNILNQVKNAYRESSNEYTIGEFISKLEDLKFYRQGLFKQISEYEIHDKTYEDVLKVPLLEFVNLVRYNKRPDISTQHGVKGEGHDKVCFVLEDSTRYRPFLYMYDFLEMYVLFNDFVAQNYPNNEQEVKFNLADFQALHYEFSKRVMQIEKRLGKKAGKLTNTAIQSNLTDIFDVIDRFINNPYYRWIYGERLLGKTKNKNEGREGVGRNGSRTTEIDKYLEQRKKGEFDKDNINQLLKYTDVERILTAYKLFYVGCSRAKDELILVVDKNKVQSFEEQFVSKFKKIGFIFK